MRETRATVLAVEAGRTLMLDREEMLQQANQAGISIVGFSCYACHDENFVPVTRQPPFRLLAPWTSSTSISPGDILGEALA